MNIAPWKTKNRGNLSTLSRAEWVNQAAQTTLYIKLIDQGTYCGEPMYTSEAGAQRVIQNTLKKMLEKLEEWKRAIETGT